MALHFERSEFSARLKKLQTNMQERNLDAMLLFAQESMYWLTGYDTFGYCFFQTLIVTKSGEMTLLTRSADLRQAQHTSIIEDIVIWKDQQDADPSIDLHELLKTLNLAGTRIGVEYDTAGITGKAARAIDARLADFAELSDQSDIVHNLRLIKSEAELAYVRKSGELADDALDAAISLTKAGADEGDILAAMHSAIFSKGGDYAGNEFIIGSDSDALLCRYKSGRRKLSQNDQLTLEWAGTYAHYHAAMMRTLVIGEPRPRHLELYQAAKAALLGVESAMQVGNTFGDMFQAHADAMDNAGLAEHRLNACGYNLGAVFTPCWMDFPMIYERNEAKIEPNMVLFAHMIIMDSESDTAMTLGHSFITKAEGPECLSRHEIDLIRC